MLVVPQMTKRRMRRRRRVTVRGRGLMSEGGVVRPSASRRMRSLLCVPGSVSLLAPSLAVGEAHAGCWPPPTLMLLTQPFPW